LFCYTDRSLASIRSQRHPHLAAFFSMTTDNTKTLGKGPLIITGLVLLLLILHQDNWFWTDSTLVFGFMPIGLAWHAGLSIAATATWLLATKIAWPLDDSTPTEKLP
jgi:hypothetical protein